MINKIHRFAVYAICGILFSACQTIDISRVKNMKQPKKEQALASIYCAGTPSCEFDRIDNIALIDEKSHRVNKAALKQGLVRWHAAHFKKVNNLYLSVPADLHEVVIRFYPISQEKAEVIHVIHRFMPNQRYVFKMYRERNKHTGSLLKVSAPEPLCVDLLQDAQVIRRFCRPYNAMTGLGEFIEKKL